MVRIDGMLRLWLGEVIVRAQLGLGHPRIRKSSRILGSFLLVRLDVVHFARAKLVDDSDDVAVHCEEEGGGPERQYRP